MRSNHEHVGSGWMAGWAAVFYVALMFMALLTAGHAQRTLRVEATGPFPATGPADYQPGASRAPDGSTIGVTDRYLTRNGKPWLPVMGEMHYSRMPEAEWEDEILKMKTAGVDIISTYILWNHHEEVKGVWDWTGERDLRHFAELCRKHGMLVYPRLGPWAHAEARNGGLPDWVVAAGPVRQMDPAFMAATAELYRQTGEQLRGLMWKDGGPVIGVQIENEYAGRGALEGERYLLALKRLAVESGFDVPLYTVTGWDNAVVPAHAMLPVYGGYPDAPWGDAPGALPPPEVYAFRFKSRVSGNMGMIGAGAGAVQESGEPARTPFMTAEIGGGIEDTYHRRPVVSADDIAAMMPVMLGSGVNLYGSYMFHGGQNPEGKLTTLEESQATRYPTDVPEKSYDFQAPIGEYGLERRSLRVIKEWNYLLNDFGGLLAPMPAFAPTVLPKSPADLSVLRFSVRTDGRQGFLFVNNYVRGARMPARPGTQFAVALPGGTLRIPEEPVDVPSGVYFAWPFQLDLGGVPLRYATAQLMTRLVDPVGGTFVFACVRGVRCELAFEGSVGVEAPGVERRGGVTLVRAGGEQPVRVKLGGGKQVSFLLLSAEEAEDAWKVRVGGEERLLRTSADVFADDPSERVTLRSIESGLFRFTLYPAARAEEFKADVPIRQQAQGSYSAQVPEVAFHVDAEALRPAGVAAPVTLGPAFAWRPRGVATAPGAAAWETAAARWTLHLSPAHLAAGISNVFLRIDYTGDAAHLTAGGKLLDDDFFNGESWLVGVDRYAPGGRMPPLELAVLPMRSDSPVYLETGARGRIAASGQTVGLGSITVLPQYQLHISSGEAEGAVRQSTALRTHAGDGHIP